MRRARAFSIPIAALLSLWAGFWTISNGIWYFSNTVNMFSVLEWEFFLLFVSPAFWIWITIVSSSWYAPLGAIFLPWGNWGGMRKGKLALLIVLTPIVVALLFLVLGEFWLPIKSDSGRIYVRMIPFL